MTAAGTAWRSFGIGLALVAVFGAACGPDADELAVTGPYRWGAATQVRQVGHLWLADQPDEAALAAARGQGVRAVINLREPAELGWNEQGAAERLGLDYFSVPISRAGPLEADSLGRIENIVRAYAESGVLLHCSSGNRAAGWLATHLVREHGKSVEAALALARSAGLTQPALESRVRDYLGAEAGEEPG